MVIKKKVWTEYSVRCRRWGRTLSGAKKWETVNLGAASEEQALQFYHDIRRKEPGGVLERPQIVVREITERPYRHSRERRGG